MLLTDSLIVEPEYIACLIILLLYIYSHFDREIHSEESTYFRITLSLSFVCAVLNLVRIYCLVHSTSISTWLNNVVQLFYLALIPWVVIRIFKYIVSTLFVQAGYASQFKSAFRSFYIATAVYLLLVLSNPFTHWLYSFDANKQVVIKNLYLIELLMYFAYVCLTLICYFRLLKYLDLSIVRLAVIGVLSILAILALQLFLPFVVFSSTALAIALLVVFINLQQTQVNIDALTGMRDRSTFFKTIETFAATGKPFRVLMVELRGLKRLNIRFGQDIGDLFLKQIARYLAEHIDVIMVCRIRSTDFGVVLKDIDQRTYDNLLSTLMSRFESPWDIANQKVIVTAGFAGLAYPDCLGTKKEVIANIEYALSMLKNQKSLLINGENSCYYVQFNQQVLQEFKRRDHLIDLINKALDQNSFRLCYQPLFSTIKNDYIGAEALLRLNDHDGTPVSPAEFIPIAEETGQISRIGWMVLEKACAFVKNSALSEDDFITVNISAQHFMEKDFTSRVVKMIEVYGIQFSQIKLEITERVLLQDLAHADRVVMELYQYGIGVFLDDFGTGYSNLFLVSQLPFECVKFDGSLIADIDSRPSAFEILRALINGVNRSGMRVLVEGIETQTQQKTVSAFGTEILQGFYLCRPLEEVVFQQKLFALR